MTNGMRWAIVITLYLMALGISISIFSKQGPKLTLEEQYQESYNYCVRVNSVNSRDINECNKIRISATPLTEAKTPNPDAPPSAEEVARQDNARDAYEKSKADWLKSNPPVKTLFDGKRIHDNNYVIEYLRENKIAGDCALAWITDVVCADWGDKIVFPTSR